MTTEVMTWGRAVREGREARGWTQEELARRLGTHTSTIQKWEGGKTEPKLGQAQAVARLLGWAQSELLELLPKGR